MCSEKINLNEYSIENVISWRENARARVDSRSKEINSQYKNISILVNKVNKVERKNVSDLRWLKKLNRHLSKRVFG